MFRRNLSTGSSTTSLTFGRHRGFTLVEIMMSTVLVAIGTSLAVPSYRNMVEKRQLTQSAEQLAAFVDSVQSISTRSNQVVTVSYSRTASNNWCIGAVVGATACNCNQVSVSAPDFCKIDSQPFLLNESLSGGSDLVYAVSGDGNYAFDPIRGLFVDTNDALSMELHSNNQAFRLKLEVNNTGRVVLCSVDANHDVPGYELCPQPIVVVALPGPLPPPL